MKKEQERLVVLNKVLVGELSKRQAAQVLGLSVRHVKRLLAGYRKEGARVLAHGNRGKKPKHALDERMKKKVAVLASSTYVGVNTQHFTELLAEREDIMLSRSSVRRILLTVGLTSPRNPDASGQNIAVEGRDGHRRVCCCRLTAVPIHRDWKEEGLI